MTETESNLLHVNPYASAIEELTWYFGSGSAAMGIAGIDYRTLGSGASRVEDEPRHDARVLAPMHPTFRYGLWKRAWVEMALGRMGWHAARESLPTRVLTVLETLRIAFTPRRWRGRVGLSPKGQKAAAWPESAELQLRRAMRIGDMPVGMTKSKTDPSSGADLVPLALASGVAQNLYESDTAVKAAREKDPDFAEASFDDLLVFLHECAQIANKPDLGQRRTAAQLALERARTKTWDVLAPALSTYTEAASDRDRSLTPEAIKSSEAKRREVATADRQEREWEKNLSPARRRARTRVERLRSEAAALNPIEKWFADLEEQFPEIAKSA